MATRSVIEVDILDAKFKNFVAEFEKLQAALKKMPSDWQKVGSSAAKGAQTGNEGLNKAFKAQKGITDEISRAEKNQKNFNKSARDGAHELEKANRMAASIAKNMASSAVSAAKWLTFGALGAGFGLGGLAGSASDYRKQAQGLGISTGQLRAANVNLGRYISPESVLSNIANVQSDLSKQHILGRLAPGSQGKNAADILPDAILNAISQFKAGGQKTQYAEAQGLTQIFTLEELKRLSSLSEKELASTIEQYKADQKKLAIDDADSRAWQDFFVKLKQSGNVLETSLIRSLTTLTPQLAELSNVVTKAVTDFLSSEGFKKTVEEFTAYLSSPEFKSDVKSFFDALGEMGRAVAKIARLINGPTVPVGQGLTNVTPSSVGGAVSQGLSNYGTIMSKIYPLAERNFNPGNLRFAGQRNAAMGEGNFAKFSSNEAGLQAMADQLRLYQNRDKLNTIQQIVSKYAPRSENDTAAYIANVSRATGFAPNQNLNLDDQAVLSRLISAMTKQENSRSNFTPDIVSRVIVYDNTGGNVTTNAVTLPGAGNSR